jgi:hypothetical protein
VSAHELADLVDGIQRARRRLAMHSGDHPGLEVTDGLFDLGGLDRPVVLEFHPTDLGADRGGHLANTVAEDAGADGEDPVPGPKAALERAPQCDHAFASHHGNAVIRAQYGAQLRLDVEVKPDVLRFQVGGTVVDEIGLPHRLWHAGGTGNQGDIIGQHCSTFSFCRRS